MTGHLHQIRLLDAEARVHQLERQVAVVGQEQQAFAVLVEPADGVDALRHMRHEIDGARPAGGIVIGAEVAARLVDEPVDRPLDMQRLAIDGDGLFARLDLRAEFAHHLSIDRDTAAHDQFFTVAPGADARVCQKFIETFHNRYCSDSTR